MFSLFCNKFPRVSWRCKCKGIAVARSPFTVLLLSFSAAFGTDSCRKQSHKCSLYSVQGRNHLHCEDCQRVDTKWFEPGLGSEGFVWKGFKSHSTVTKVSCNSTSLPNLSAGSFARDGIPKSEFRHSFYSRIMSRSFKLILLLYWNNETSLIIPPI